MKEYTVLNQRLVINDDAERYFSLKAKFNMEADNVANKYGEKYIKYCKDKIPITTVIDNYFDDIKECSDYLVDEMLNRLRANDIYDKTKEAMYRIIGDFGKDDTQGYREVEVAVSAATAYHSVQERQNEYDSMNHGTWEVQLINVNR